MSSLEAVWKLCRASYSCDSLFFKRCACQVSVGLGVSGMSRTHLVNCQVLPLDLPEVHPIFQNEFVCREEDVESEVLEGPELSLSDNLPRFGRPHVTDDVHVGGPIGELHLPGAYGRQWYHYQEWTVLLLGMEEVREEGYRLNGFTQTHLWSVSVIETFKFC